MEEKFIIKMLKKSFLQYGRDINEDPLSENDLRKIIIKINEVKEHNVEWYEVIEDVVYGYLTNQD